MKHVISSFALLIILIAGNQYQVHALSQQDQLANREATYQVALSQYNACLGRVESRDTLRELLLGVYDDVQVVLPKEGPGAEIARAFKERGYERIDSKYPAYPDGYCGEPPVKP